MTGGVRQRILALGSSGLILGMLLAPPILAQAAQLSVRPHEIKGADRTAQAGDLLLDSLPGYSLYVPQACVGQRCPLLVAAADIPQLAVTMPQTMLGWLRPVADKYGIVMLGLEPYLPVPPADVSSSLQPSRGKEADIDPRGLDAALTQVLQKVAIDPDRIALLGYQSLPAAGAPAVVRNAWPVAVQNPNVFSRVVLSSPGAVNRFLPPPAPPTRPTQFLLSSEVTTYPTPDTTALMFAKALRRQGYPAELLLTIRAGGRGMWEELDGIGQWLRDSWAAPGSAGWPVAGVGAEAMPLLTLETIGRLSQFWANFRQEPDSIRRVGRRAYLRNIVLPIGDGAERPAVVMTDMAALASKYPSVAAKLRAAGLTAREHDAYRLAFVSAKFAAAFADSTAAPADPVTVTNAAFLKAQKNAEVFYSEGLMPVQSDWLASAMWQIP